MRIESGFQPVPFIEENPFTSDPVLKGILRRTLPENIFQEIEPDLVRLGADVITSIRSLGTRVEAPSLIQYDQWGRRIDELKTSEGWRELKAVAQKEGIPAIFYERKYQEHSRSYGFAKVMLMSGESHMVFCPLSMTDGAARAIELTGTPGMKRHIFPRLISRDPSIAFTSGQWMTERPGGSDVSQTETIALWTGKSGRFGPIYHLDGFKWFSSATDSDIAVALARTGSPNDGSRGLSLFLVPLRLPLLRYPSTPQPSSTSNGVYVHRLKNKIGTHSLPTAELSLESSESYLIGSLNKGVSTITPVLNITRLWSATGTIGGLRKCLAIATSYANVRAIRGGKQLLRDTPLHVAQLASISLVYRALTHLTFGAIRLIGKVECGTASLEEQHRLRIMTPTTKAFVAEKACTAMEEAMTCLGGAGYMEENGFGRLIRDSLVEKIWEGTTTILALDLVRAAQDGSTLNSFISWGRDVISSCPVPLQNIIQEPLTVLHSGVEDLAIAYTIPIPTLVPRPALFVMGHVASSLYLLEHAIWAYKSGDVDEGIDTDVFSRWVLEGGLIEAVKYMNKARKAESDRGLANSAIAFGRSPKAKL